MLGAIAATVVAGALGACGAPGATSTRPVTTPPSPATTRPPVPPATTAPSTTPTATPTTTPPTPPVTLLGPGASGPAVSQLQARLVSLGYWLGTPTGTYDELTAQAVVALQKAAGIARDGIFGPETAQALAQGVRPTPRSHVGRVIEIDLRTQLLMIVTDGHLEEIFDTSTGGGYTYVSQGVTAVATTPTGSFHIYRQVDGRDVSPLGVLWRPKYFVGGIAIHGYGEVPPYAASHGCVRVSDAAIDWIWDNDEAPIGTAVLVY